MVHRLSLRTSVAAAVASVILFAPALRAQRSPTGELSGTVTADAGKGVGEATLQIARNDGSGAQTAVTDANGAFRIRALAPGLYHVTARRIGFHEAQRRSIRIIAGQTTEIHVTLTSSPTQLSTVEVRVSPTSIDASTSELARRIGVEDVGLVPAGRDANSLIELVPGATKGFVWGGAGDAANNYQIDGVSVNHPGIGGDFLSPSIDWIEALEVRGLGAGAESGEFQGAIINAVTKTGSNNWRGSLRANYISPSLTSSNIRPNEEGAEQSMRREFSGETSGPIIKDRLYYFLGGIILDRAIQVPDLTTIDLDDLRSEKQDVRDLRGIAKLTFLPGLHDRIDALVSHRDNQIDRAELNGLNDPVTSLRVRSPTRFYEAAWTRTGLTSSFVAKVAGFDSRETRLGYEGDSVPGIQIFSLGRQPVYQNALFNQRTRPRNVSGNVSYSKTHTLPGGENKIVLGAEVTRGWWENSRTRNGGLTWMPYLHPITRQVDPYNAQSWPEVASEWGGEMHLDSDVEDDALFAQDYLTLLPGLTFTPGLRYGRWTGWLTPVDSADGRFLAVRHKALDPRFGVVWDISGRNDLVMKAHWGRYHQSMNSLFFDRAQGADVYSNETFFFQGPSFTDSRRVYTAAQRDALRNSPTGFQGTSIVSILNEAGAPENYRQPYVEQALLSVEKRFGPKWKLEAMYVNRVNKDIVGLVDHNLANNYSPIRNVVVKDHVTQITILDQFGAPLVIPVLYVANNDLRADLIRRRDGLIPRPPTPGYSFADINRLTYTPDIQLTTVDGARRAMHQFSLTLRTERKEFSGFGSLTFTSLRGNTSGLTAFGTTGSTFSAGSAVRPNEGINAEGYLPNFPPVESKIWLSGELPYGFRGGVFATYSLGNFFTPTFQITPRFRFQASSSLLDDELLTAVEGQTILLEERGNRKYPSRSNLDLRLERRFKGPGFDWLATADAFNVLASDAVIERNLTINDQISTDPTSTFAAPRRRVNPLAIQLGMRVEF
ncbi:MAG TPA: carboxypeptidase regulatory-like domain-containing protein [Gemmatimonadaceae bacterium]|nr:carboxypeptidase regulatory-like domain-containing protein [Gemmatimonadaceae bacterium]